MGELGQFQEVHEVVVPKFSGEYKHAVVIEGEEVLTLRPQERGTHKLFVTTDKIPEGKMETAIDG